MADEPPATPHADPEEEVDRLREEIEARAPVHSTDFLDLWKEYVRAYREASLADRPAEEMAAEIVRSSDTAFSVDVSEAGTLHAITVGLLEGRALDTPSADNVDTGGDPIQLFDGRLLHQATDMVVDGAGITLSLVRTYQSGIRTGDLVGPGWDLSTNLYIREFDSVLFVGHGDGREVVFTRHVRYGESGFTWYVPPPGEHAAVIPGEGAISWIWRSASGLRRLFAADPSHPGRHRITRVEDRFGNHLHFHWSGDLLATVDVNSPHRQVHFVHDDLGRVRQVSDHSTSFGPNGRRWSYEYDDRGDLVRVVSPPRNPGGPPTVRCYEYTTASEATDLAHRLIRIVDERGATLLENEYGRDRGFLSYGRVVRQRIGDAEWSYEYGRFLDQAPTGPRQWRTVELRPNGHAVEHRYNRRGNLVERIQLGDAEGDASVGIASRFVYNADGALTASLTPEGRLSQYLHGRDRYRLAHLLDADDVDGHADLDMVSRMAFGNLLAVVERADQRPGLDLESLTSDPPDVLTAGADDIVTKYEYEPDYQQRTSASDPRFTLDPDPARRTPPHEHPRHLETLRQWSYGGPSGDPNRELRSARLPAATVWDGSTQPAAERTVEQRDDRGRPLRVRDEDGFVVETAYFDAGSGPREGYVRSETTHSEAESRMTRFEVDELGFVVATLRPGNTGPDDERFSSTVQRTAYGRKSIVTGSAPFRFRTEYRYDSADRLEEIRELPPAQDGEDAVRVTRSVRNVRGDVVREEDGGAGLWRRVEHRYTSTGEREQTIDPRGVITRYTHDALGNAIAVTRAACTPEEATERATFTPDGLQASRIDATGRSWRYRYDAFGRRISATDPLGNRAETRYDKAGNVTHRRTLQLLPSGGFLLVSAASSEYDERGRLRRQIRHLAPAPIPLSDLQASFLPSGTVPVSTAHQFDQRGNVVVEVDPLGRTTSWTVNGFGERTRRVDPAGNTTSFDYDARGNLARTTVEEPRSDDPAQPPDLFRWTREYDELDRLVGVRDPIGNVTRYEYDRFDDVAAEVDPVGRRTEYLRDGLGRIVEERLVGTESGSLPSTTEFTWDADGNRLSMRDPLGNETRYSYDLHGRPGAKRFADGTLETTRYDQDGRLVEHADGRGCVERRSYDQAGRLHRVDCSGGSLPSSATRHTEYERDADGHVLRETSDFAEISRALDTLGRPRSEDLAYSIPTADGGFAQKQFRVEFEYLESGRISSIRYPSGTIVSYQYSPWDAVRRVTETGPAADASPQTIVENSFRGRRLDATTHGNGLVTTYAHDGKGRPIEITVRGGATLFRSARLFGGDDAVRYLEESGVGTAAAQAFRHDAMGNLSAVRSLAVPSDLAIADFSIDADAPADQSAIDTALSGLPAGTPELTLGYDLNRNRTSEDSGGGTTVSYTVNSLNQYAGVGAELLRYDEAGNLSEDADRSYGYDAESRLVEVRRPSDNAILARFYHDAAGRMIAVQSADQLRWRVFSGPNLIEEYDGDTLHRRYVTQFAVDSVVYSSSGSGGVWVHRDAGGSVRLLTDEQGSIESTLDFDPFGRGQTLPDLDYLFHGRPAALGGDIFFFRRRAYSRKLGRFLQRDPIDGPNAYAFADNDPMSGSDPSGYETESSSSPFDLRLRLDTREVEQYLVEQQIAADLEAIADAEPTYLDKLSNHPATYSYRYLWRHYHRMSWSEEPFTKGLAAVGTVPTGVFGGLTMVGWEAIRGIGWVYEEVDPTGAGSYTLMQQAMSTPVPFDDVAAGALRGVGLASRAVRASARAHWRGLHRPEALRARTMWATMPTRQLGAAGAHGNIYINPRLQGNKELFALTWRHELGHRWFKPKLRFGYDARASVSGWLYQHSAFMRASEEMIVQTNALARTYGARRAIGGIGYPFRAGYTTVGRYAAEGAVAGGVVYGGYRLTSAWLSGD